MLNRPLALIAVLLLILLLVWFQRRPEPPVEIARTALIMGTLVEIKGFGVDEKSIDAAINAAFSVMRDEEERFSPEIEASQLSAINRTESAIEVDGEVVALLKLGQQLSRKSAGAFHMGLGGVKKLWDFEALEPRVPNLAEIKAILPDPLADVVIISGNKVRRSSPLVLLDLGGIAKGYAVDKALALLRSAGLSSASINAGGDIGLLGGHGERPWKIGIQHPRKLGELLATVELRNKAIVTSGDYERFFMIAGTRYHHIFDPQNGLPARGCQSVSVIAPSAAEADALATAAFVLGPEKGLQLLEQSSEVEGLIVAGDGSVEVTSGLKDKVQWQ